MNADGALYVFDLTGKIIEEKTVRALKRLNNVDVAYGLMLDGVPTDIAVATEREANRLRVFSLPDMKVVDNGGELRCSKANPKEIPWELPCTRDRQTMPFLL